MADTKIGRIEEVNGNNTEEEEEKVSYDSSDEEYNRIPIKTMSTRNKRTNENNSTKHHKDSSSSEDSRRSFDSKRSTSEQSEEVESQDENKNRNNKENHNELADQQGNKTSNNSSNINIYVSEHEDNEEQENKVNRENEQNLKESATADENKDESDEIDELKRRIFSVVGNQIRKKPQRFRIEDLESVNRISSIPIVESGWHYAEGFYKRIKKSNNLFNWTFEQAESSIQSVIDTALPAVVLFQGPITTIDKILCKSLDMVEDRVPAINLPPQMIYNNTKQYVTEVSAKIARPVLERADSVKEFGNTVLASKYTAFAADTLDGALDVADKYVDKYLPAEYYDDNNTDEPDNKNTVAEGPTGKAYHTIYHVDRFSRKLQRRLTKRTLAEAKALKEHSAEAIHVLIYVAELVATDPKLAYQKGLELWASLSKDEPENQARPENLEQLIVMLTRESARRVVHFVNFTAKVLSTVPRKVSNTLLNLTHLVLTTTDSLVKTVHLEGVENAVIGVAKFQARLVTNILRQINAYFTEVLDKVAQDLQPAEQPKGKLEVPRIKVQLRANIRNSSHTTKVTSNGIEMNS